MLDVCQGRATLRLWWRHDAWDTYPRRRVGRWGAEGNPLFYGLTFVAAESNHARQGRTEEGWQVNIVTILNFVCGRDVIRFMLRN
jgi:hypothetical protein